MNDYLIHKQITHLYFYKNEFDKTHYVDQKRLSFIVHLIGQFFMKESPKPKPSCYKTLFPDDNDDEVVTAHHAYLAYGHQLQAIHFAEMAAVEDESVDHADVDHSHHD